MQPSRRTGGSAAPGECRVQRTQVEAEIGIAAPEPCHILGRGRPWAVEQFQVDPGLPATRQGDEPTRIGMRPLVAVELVAAASGSTSANFRTARRQPGRTSAPATVAPGQRAAICACQRLLP